MTAFTTLPAWLLTLLVPFAMFCLAVLIWAILPRRAPSARRNADIERQIATLRRHADHSVTHRPRVRGNGCTQPAPTHIKAAPQAPHAAKPRPCGGGLCRHRADCADHHCPGRPVATPARAPRHATH